jgi:hypothetical protein
MRKMKTFPSFIFETRNNKKKTNFEQIFKLKMKIENSRKGTKFNFLFVWIKILKKTVDNKFSAHDMFLE